MDFLQRRKKDLNTFALEVGRDFGAVQPGQRTEHRENHDRRNGVKTKPLPECRRPETDRVTQAVELQSKITGRLG